MTTDFDIVIVGGGAAAIGAARRLAHSNHSTLLLEAGPRLGGRACTQVVSGFNLDLGCGWFHSAERNAWVGIAEDSGVVIDRSVAKWGTQFHDLGFTKQEQVEARQAFAAWMGALDQAGDDNAANALVAGGAWNDYIRTIVGFISGAALENLSIADYLAYDEASSDNNWRTPTGYGALVASSIPAQVETRLAAPVEALALGQQGVTVSTPAGVVRARAAIVTVSSAVLAGDSLKLPLELEPWREAARLLPLGRNEKLFLEIVGDAPFAPESQVLGNPRDLRTGSYYIRPLGAPLIECFFGAEGARFVEASGAAAGFDYAIGQLCALFGSSVRSALRPLVASGWSQMKRIGGAYSYALPGHAAARSALARPFDNRVFFAGEATSPGDFSTTHGAHDSGLRAANQVITALRPQF